MLGSVSMMTAVAYVDDDWTVDLQLAFSHPPSLLNPLGGITLLSFISSLFSSVSGRHAVLLRVSGVGIVYQAR